MGEGQHGLVCFQLGAVDRLAELQPLVADRPAGATGEAGAGGLAPAGAHHQGHPIVAGDLHGPRVEHGGAEAGQLEHFITADAGHQLGIGHLAGVGGEHPGHIGVDLAGVSPQRRRQGHRRGVRSPPAQGGDFGGAAGAAAGALEARHHHHLAISEQAQQPVGADFQDAGAAVGRFGDDAGLGAGHRDGRHALRMEGHRQQGDRHLFTGGQQHVHLPPGRISADGRGQAGELVGGVAHGRHHDHQLVALLPAAGDAAGHRLNPLHIGHRGAAKLLNQQGHGGGGVGGRL